MRWAWRWVKVAHLKWAIWVCWQKSCYQTSLSMHWDNWDCPCFESSSLLPFSRSLQSLGLVTSLGMKSPCKSPSKAPFHCFTVTQCLRLCAFSQGVWGRCGESLMNSSTQKLAKRQIVYWHHGELEQAVHGHPARLSHRSVGALVAALRTNC